MKQNLLIPLLCFALVLPVYTVGAQEDEQETAQETTPQAAQVTVQETEREATQETAKETTQAPAPRNTGQSRQTQGTDDISVWINKIVGYVSQIGNVFGKTLGFRIGGTTGTAIAALAIAKLLQDRAPSWVRWALYLTGGTMVAGSGANITQTIMRVLGG